MGDPISQPADRPRLQRVLNYILRPALPLNLAPYDQAGIQVVDKGGNTLDYSTNLQIVPEQVWLWPFPSPAGPGPNN